MTITFSKNQTVGKADKMIYGQFLEHFHRQVYGGIFDPSSKFADEDGFRTDVLDAMRKIKVPVIRWPGGCYVSAYDWHYGVGKERVATFDKAWRVEEPNTFGTDEFVKMCRKIGCEPFICTNAGTGTAEEMSNWVEYCNLRNEGRFAKERIANGNPEPYNVKYWSVGNENWGGHEIGSKDAQEWGRLVIESGKMMQRVDPTIELSAAAIGWVDWNFNLLKTAGRILNWISIHSYWHGSADGLSTDPYENCMARTGRSLVDQLDKTRGMLQAFGLERQIRVAYDEWNFRGWYHPNAMNIHNDGHYSDDEVFLPRNRNDVNSTYTMVDAIFSGCFLNAMLRNCDIVGMACFSPIVNTRGAIFTYEDGIVLRPQYYVFDLYANLMKDNVLNVWSEDVEKLDSVPGNEKIDVIDAVVTYGDGMFAVSAVNKDKDSARSFDLRSIGSDISSFRIHTLNGPSVDSYNDVGKTDVGVKVSDWKQFTGSITLEPHSVNVIELK